MSDFSERITKVYNAIINRINATIALHNSDSSAHSFGSGYPNKNVVTDGNGRLVTENKVTKTSDLTNDGSDGTNVFVSNNDSRLTNNRTPTSHASTATTYGIGTTTKYGHCMTINNVTQTTHQNGKALSAYQGKVLQDNINQKVDKETGKGLFSGSYNDLNDKPSYTPTVTSSTTDSYKIGSINLSGTATDIYGKNSDTIYTHPTSKQCNYAYTHPSTQQCTHNHNNDYVSKTQGSENNGKFLKVSGGNVVCEEADTYVHPSTKQCGYEYIHPNTQQCTHNHNDVYYTEDEVNDLLSDKVDAINLATIATTGSYTDLSNTPTIPTKTSDLTNDSDFVNSEDLENFEKVKPAIEFSVTGSGFGSAGTLSYSGDVIIDYGDGTIEECTGSISHTYSTSGTYTVKMYGNITALNYQFLVGQPINYIILGDSITSLGENCFRNCSRLTSVTLPKNLVSIGTTCFAYGTQITSLNIPSTVTSIGGGCFANVSTLNTLILNWDTSDSIIPYDTSSWLGNSSVSSFSIPQDTTSLYTAKSYPSSMLVERTTPDVEEETATEEEVVTKPVLRSHLHTKDNILDFPTLSTVAISGSYNDLTDKPNIPSTNTGTFTELQTLINNANDGDIITLTKDYKNTGSESSITISSGITINGSGHTIDADGNNGIFYIEAYGDFNILNTTFANAINNGAIDIYSDMSGSLLIENCVFKNNTRDVNNNHSGSRSSPTLTIRNSIFENSTQYSIYHYQFNEECYVYDSVFINTSLYADDYRRIYLYNCQLINSSVVNGRYTQTDYLTTHQNISGKENTSNKITSLSSSSTDTQYPSAKAVYDVGKNTYNYKLSSSAYVVEQDDPFTITCEVTNIYGEPVANVPITLKNNNSTVATGTTNSLGIYEREFMYIRGVFVFSVEDSSVTVYVDAWAEYNHNHDNTYVDWNSLGELDISELTDNNNLIPTNVSDLTDTDIVEVVVTYTDDSTETIQLVTYTGS